MAASKGNCFLCGAELGKVAMKNHILKKHTGQSNTGPVQKCLLLKVEGAYGKNYWLYLDVPLNKPLSAVDEFLRAIWLECCGHLSAFYEADGRGYEEINPAKKWSFFSPGDCLRHDYDFGDTTETLITVVDTVERPAQKEAVRLLARNVPPQFTCVECGAPAEYICTECRCQIDQPFYCAKCAEDHEHEDLMLLPVTNSPRMGVCGYCGDGDVYEYSPPRLQRAREHVTPQTVHAAALRLRAENARFRVFLKTHAKANELDRQFSRLHEELFSQFDCCQCGNCCREYRTLLTEQEIDGIAKRLNLSEEAFVEDYLVETSDGLALDAPCPFLGADGKCAIQDCKPEECRGFPHTDAPGRLERMYSILSFAEACPVLFEILERLKDEYHFEE